MGRRPLVVVNPVAGGGRAAGLAPLVLDLLARRGLSVDHALTTRRGEARRLAGEAADGGASLVVALGGDGTLNEVINGVIDPAGRPRAAVGVVLAGRGCDAARTLGVPRSPREAAERLAAGSERRVDLGHAVWPGGARFFVNALGVGFDAHIAGLAAQAGGHGALAYLRAVVRGLGAYRPADVTIAQDGGPPTPASVASVVVANGPTFGGGMRVAPAADATDGLLDLVVLGALWRWELAAWLPTLYWGGHLRHPKVLASRARVVHLDGPAPLPVQIDGELDGALPLDIRICPGALRLRA